MITKLIETGISGFKARGELNTLKKYLDNLSKQISEAEREPDKAVKEITLHVILTSTLLKEESWTVSNKQGEPAQNSDNALKIRK